MNIKKITPFFVILIGIIIFSGCQKTEYKELGTACNENSTCEDVCHTGFPEGMCTTSCDANNPCDEGVCVTFTDGGWCLPECEVNSDCREGYSCILGSCRPVSNGGEPCDDSNDCADSLECIEGLCSHQCSNAKDCKDVGGTYCTVDASETGYWCLPPITDPNLGVSCYVSPRSTDSTENLCAENYVCLPSYNNLDAYCSTTCESDRDCLRDMSCREVSTADGLVKMCIKRDYCEPCNTDDECGNQKDKCIGSDPSKIKENFCSHECDPLREAATCPLDSKCKQVYFCESTNSWVPDCSWCEGNCSTDGPKVYQCIPDYGACVGTGALCEPCRTQEKCANGDGGVCLTSLDNAFCTKPCDGDTDCPDGFMCYDVGVSQKQCIPGNISCTNPQLPED